MKRALLLMLMVLLTTMSYNSFAQCKTPCKHKTSKCDTEKQAQISKAEVMVYYFHNARRCATCTAVEEITEKAIKDNFAEELKSGKIGFISLNIEEDKNKKLAEKLEVSGQTLIIVKGEKKVNLTNDAFMYVKTKPEKLEAKIKKNLDKLV
jgi:hypothetical protein